MKNTEQGILISRLSYSESSYIIKVFTENFGLRSFLFQGAKKKKGLVFYAFSHIEFSYYLRQESSLCKMTDYALISSPNALYFNPVIATIIFFKTKILSKALHEDVPDKGLFAFLIDEIAHLEQELFLANYPIYWMIDLSKHLGFIPNVVDEDPLFFDLENGELTSIQPINFSYKSGVEVKLLASILTLSRSELLLLKMDKQMRANLTHLLILYFSFHIPNFDIQDTMDVINAIWE